MRGLAAGIAFTLALAALAAVARADAAGDPVRGVRALEPRAGDAVYGAVSVTSLALLVPHDVALSRMFSARQAPLTLQLARIANPIGREGVIGGGALMLAGAALAHDRDLVTRVGRADASIVAAGACAFALKKLVGRERPEDSPDNALVFHPFTHSDAFPSGHSTLAFAAAAALDRETTSGWVPALAYPIAASVGWARVHDRKHWVTDVIAGAALGFAIAWKAEDFQRGRR